MGPNMRPIFSVESKSALSGFFEAFEAKDTRSGIRSVDVEAISVSEMEKAVLDHVAVVERMSATEPTAVFANSGVMKLMMDRYRAPFSADSEVVTVVLGAAKLSPLIGLSMDVTRTYESEPTAVMASGAKALFAPAEENLPVLGPQDEITQVASVSGPMAEAARDARIPAFDESVESVGGRIFQSLEELSAHPLWRSELGRATLATQDMPPETAALAARLSSALQGDRLNQLGGLIAETTVQMMTETSDAEASRLLRARDGFVAEAGAILKDIDAWKSVVAARDLALRQVVFPFDQAAVAHQASLRNDGFVPKPSPLPFASTGVQITRVPSPGMTAFVTGEPSFAAAELLGMFGRNDLPREFAGWEKLTATRTPDAPNRLIVRGEKDGHPFTFSLNLVRLAR